MVNDALIEKVQKLLELARRGGTEAEAENAMQKVHVILAKYNLSMSDAETVRPVDEAIGTDRQEKRGVEIWHRYIYNGIANLYFSRYWYSSCYQTDWGNSSKKRITAHTIIGKPSNVAIIRNMCAYLIGLGNSLANSTFTDQRMRNSFKKGFGHRISSRCFDEIAKAKSGKIVDNTGRALIVAPVYEKAKYEIDAYLGHRKFRGGGRSLRISNQAGFSAGMQAADRVSLKANLVGSDEHGNIARIGHEE